jgi:hypothetical protein
MRKAVFVLVAALRRLLYSTKMIEDEKLDEVRVDPRPAERRPQAEERAAWLPALPGPIDDDVHSLTPRAKSINGHVYTLKLSGHVYTQRQSVKGTSGNGHTLK